MNEATSTMRTTTCHPEHLLDRAAMLAMRPMIALPPTAAPVATRHSTCERGR